MTPAVCFATSTTRMPERSPHSGRAIQTWRALPTPLRDETSARCVVDRRVIGFGCAPEAEVVGPPIGVVPTSATFRDFGQHRRVPGQPLFRKPVVYILLALLQVRALHRIVDDVEQERVLAQLEIFEISVADGPLRVSLVAPKQRAARDCPTSPQHGQEIDS